jgi:hypothetical protein
MDQANAFRQPDIALVVTIMRGRAIAPLLDVREISKFETQAHQYFRFNFPFSIRNKLGKNPPILAKNVVHVAHVRRRIAVKLVMPCRTAMIITELFIGAANDALPTLHTEPLDLQVRHSIKVKTNPSLQTGDTENQTGDTLGLPGIRTT